MADVSGVGQSSRQTLKQKSSPEQVETGRDKSKGGSKSRDEAGPAYILDLSPEAREILAKRNKSS